MGAVRLGTSPLGPTLGRISELEVHEAERRRGRGTAAVLAAEETLREWGCEQGEAVLPATATAVRALAAALGYQERNRTMRKDLDARPDLPAGVTCRRMSESEFDEWRSAGQRQYAESLMNRGIPPRAAREKAAADHASMLADGLDTPDTALRVLCEDGRPVGTLWLTLRAPDGGPGGYVLDVRVLPDQRGRGHGRSLMLAAEQETLAAGRASLGLNVFTGNTAAERLYESLGYQDVALHVSKAL